MSEGLTTPRHDETVYSMLARMSRYAGSPPSRAFLAAMFGDADVSAADDMPSGLGAIVASGRLGAVDLRFAAAEWTSLPYYAAFADPGRLKVGMAAMRSTGSWPLGVVGGWTVGVAPADHLRFCPYCIAEQVEQHPDAWWRRAHQLPSVLVCPDHGVPLLESAVCRERRRLDLIPAGPGACPPSSPPVVATDDVRILADLRQLAIESDALLDVWPCRHPDDAREDYLARLAPLGMLNRAGEAKLAAVAAAAFRRWGLTLALWPGLITGKGCAQGWLGTLLMGEHRSPPLHHLLFQGTLGFAERWS